MIWWGRKIIQFWLNFFFEWHLLNFSKWISWILTDRNLLRASNIRFHVFCFILFLFCVISSCLYNRLFRFLVKSFWKISMFSQVQGNRGSWDFATNMIIKALHVVNDHAKCVVAFIHEYSGLMECSYNFCFKLLKINTKCTLIEERKILSCMCKSNKILMRNW